MWNDNDIFANDIAEKFEQRMFCNFGGGSSSSSSGGEPRGVTISGGTLKGGTTKGSMSTPSGTVEGINDPYEAELAMQAAAGGSGSQLNTGFDFTAGGDDQPSLQELQDITAINTAIRNSLGVGSVPEVVRDLNIRSGYMNTGSGAPFSLQNLLKGNFNPMQFGLLGQASRFIGENASQQLLKGVSEGYLPQYNSLGQIVATINPETGRYGAGSVVSRIDPTDPRNEPVPVSDMSDDGGDFVAPEATAVAVAQPEEVREPNFPMDYRYPAGGIYPEEGMYQRMGLLDVAPMQFGGLLRDYDPTQFAEMNVGFRQPTDVGLFQDPYDVTGYSLV